MWSLTAPLIYDSLYPLRFGDRAPFHGETRTRGRKADQFRRGAIGPVVNGATGHVAAPPAASLSATIAGMRNVFCACRTVRPGVTLVRAELDDFAIPVHSHDHVVVGLSRYERVADVGHDRRPRERPRVRRWRITYLQAECPGHSTTDAQAALVPLEPRASPA